MIKILLCLLVSACAVVLGVLLRLPPAQGLEELHRAWGWLAAHPHELGVVVVVAFVSFLVARGHV